MGGEPARPIGDAALRDEVRGIGRAGAKSAALCAAVWSAGYFALPRFFDFPTETVDALVFAMRANLFVLLWVVVAVSMVSRARRKSASDIGAAAFGEPTPSMRIMKAFLQNTLEQAVIAMVVNLAFATLAQGPALSLIVASVLLFGIGRVAFFRGYAGGAASRAFGMFTTALPALLGFCACLALMAIGAFG